MLNYILITFIIILIFWDVCTSFPFFVLKLMKSDFQSEIYCKSIKQRKTIKFFHINKPNYFFVNNHNIVTTKRNKAPYHCFFISHGKSTKLTFPNKDNFFSTIMNNMYPKRYNLLLLFLQIFLVVQNLLLKSRNTNPLDLGASLHHT